MGNYISNQTCGENGKVLLPNGSVHEFDHDHPLTAAELMMEHPQQVVVELRSVKDGKKLTPLPADKKLDMKRVYLMIPMKTGRAGALSVDEARRIFENANSILGSRAIFSSAEGLLPLLVRGCRMSTGVESKAILLKQDQVLEKMEESKTLKLLPENFEQRTEFLSRQVSGKGWKPSLDTIKEKKMEQKASHWLF